MYEYLPNRNGFGNWGVFANSLAVTNADYFSSLPEDVQEEINAHEDEIHSAEEIHELAENLLRRS